MWSDTSLLASFSARTKRGSLSTVHIPWVYDKVTRDRTQTILSRFTPHPTAPQKSRPPEVLSLMLMHTLPPVIFPLTTWLLVTVWLQGLLLQFMVCSSFCSSGTTKQIRGFGHDDKRLERLPWVQTVETSVTWWSKRLPLSAPFNLQLHSNHNSTKVPLSTQ